MNLPENVAERVCLTCFLLLRYGSHTCFLVNVGFCCHKAVHIIVWMAVQQHTNELVNNTAMGIGAMNTSYLI